MAPFKVLSFNCEGNKGSSVYIRQLLNSNSCDVLCLHEIWVLNTTITCLSNIHKDYDYYDVSGVDSKLEILKGRPKGGVAILHKKVYLSLLVLFLYLTGECVVLI